MMDYDSGTSTAYRSPDHASPPAHFLPEVPPVSTPEFRDAILSGDGLYRYLLTRVWGLGPVAAFVMLNPSTADGRVNDPTIQKCVGFARRWGCGSILVANMYAYRTTYPKVMFGARSRDVDIVGPHNVAFLRQAGVAARVTAGKLVVAWGANAPSDRAQEVGTMPELAGATCLGVTKDGHPRHPLMLAYNTPLEPWTPTQLAA